eukprot:scaffold26503_cov127-Cylindrotheca_fusiformis.AAC.1
MQSTPTEMNNRAARLIESDDFEEALDILSRTLNAVQEELALEDESVKSNPTPDQKSNACISPRDPSNDEFREEMLERRIKKLEKLDGFVYWHPMQAVDLPESTRNSSLSLIIVFNLALCHHLMALEKDCKERESRLHAALKLYELGISMHMEGNIVVDMTYALAMVNNCAQIFRSLNHPRKAKRFMAHMLSSLMIMIEYGETNVLDEFDGFLQNASNLILRKETAPAA